MIAPIEHNLHASTLPGASRAAGAIEALGRAPAQSVHDKLDRAASEAVGQLLFAPMLAELRKSPLGKRFGHGGRGEEVFGQQLDERVADIVASSAHSPATVRLREALYASLRLAERGTAAAGEPAGSNRP